MRDEALFAPIGVLCFINFGHIIQIGFEVEISWQILKLEPNIVEVGLFSILQQQPNLFILVIDCKQIPLHKIILKLRNFGGNSAIVEDFNIFNASADST